LFNIVLGKLHNLVAEEPLNWWPGRSTIWKLGRFFIQEVNDFQHWRYRESTDSWKNKAMG
jgi:hypothetical protein